MSNKQSTNTKLFGNQNNFKSPKNYNNNFQLPKKQYGPTVNILNRINGNYIPNSDLVNKKYRFKSDNQYQQSLQQQNKSKINHSKNKSPIKYNYNSHNNISGVTSNNSGFQNSIRSFEFDKQPQKRKGQLYEDWNEYQQMGKWENKPKLNDVSPIRFVLESDKQFQSKKNSPKGICQNRSVTPNYKQMYENNKKRDFQSQIKTLPGPTNNNARELKERPVTPERLIHPINKKMQESYFFKAGINSQSSQIIGLNKENIPNQKQINYNQQKSTNFTQEIRNLEYKPQHYPINDFLYRTPRNFLTTNDKK